MSYLHSRKIVHTDLKSKNVFLEPNNLLETTNKVVITDFGLFNVAELINKSERLVMIFHDETISVLLCLLFAEVSFIL